MAYVISLFNSSVLRVGVGNDKKKFEGVMSRDLVGRGIEPPVPIHRPENFSSKTFLTSKRQCDGTLLTLYMR
ncbi:hypothetical protein TNCV_4613101 [Trichonephila clavipes]|nr:hypothetical protein TNCV_4613101 [Trichonephila clavipes]